MNIQELLAEIRQGLTGEYSVDIVYLEGQAAKYRNTPNGREIEGAIADIAYEILPEDKKQEIGKLMYLDGKRLDAVLAEAIQLVTDKKIEEAFRLTEALYTKIRINYRETEDEIYLSLRNPLEHQLYLHLYHPSKTLQRPPFDLSRMIMLHGYVLLEMNRPEEAIRVLGDSIRYNPMNTDPFFEMAECYKALGQPEDLLSVTKETLEIATTPKELSRCYCNLGYYCVEVKDYDSAVCFYYESLIYDNNPVVQGELHHIRSITQKKLVPPSRKEVEAAFEKYGMHPGADDEVVSVVASLSKHAMETKKNDEALFYLTVLYGLTRDPDVKEMLDQYTPKKDKQPVNRAEKIQQTK